MVILVGSDVIADVAHSQPRSASTRQPVSSGDTTGEARRA